MTNESEVLHALVEAIEYIDGGCAHCIGQFVERANVGLRSIGADYRYKLTSDEHGHIILVEDKDHPDIEYYDNSVRVSD